MTGSVLTNILYKLLFVYNKPGKFVCLWFVAFGFFWQFCQKDILAFPSLCRTLLFFWSHCMIKCLTNIMHRFNRLNQSWIGISESVCNLYLRQKQVDKIFILSITNLKPTCIQKQSSCKSFIPMQFVISDQAPNSIQSVIALPSPQCNCSKFLLCGAWREGGRHM